MNHTVDGKNPAPVDMANKNIPLFTRCCRMSSINSMNQHIEFTKKSPQTYHAGDKVVNICILNNALLWSRFVFGSSQRLSATTRMVKSGYCCGQPATLALIGAHLQRRRLERDGCHVMSPENTLETLEDEVIPWCGGDVGCSSPLNFDALSISSCLSDSQCGFGS